MTSTTRQEYKTFYLSVTHSEEAGFEGTVNDRTFKATNYAHLSQQFKEYIDNFIYEKYLQYRQILGENDDR